MPAKSQCFTYQFLVVLNEVPYYAWFQHSLVGCLPWKFPRKEIYCNTSNLNSCPLRLKKILKFTSVSSLFFKEIFIFFMIFVMVLSCFVEVKILFSRLWAKCCDFAGIKKLGILQGGSEFSLVLNRFSHRIWHLRHHTITVESGTLGYL